MDFYEEYKKLLKKHGKQGWWPIIKNNKSQYHPGNYEYPRNESEKFEISIGAILTQNTTWKNAEKALIRLKKNKKLSPKAIINEDIKELIRPAGYYNQKEKKLKIFSKYYLEKKGREPTREELLGLWGIGYETADSILLYAYKKPIFVVDAYTKRIFSLKEDYETIRKKIESNLPSDYRIYQEFHALIVEEGKKSRKK